MPAPQTLRQATIPPAARQVLARLGELGFKAYLVGGCVRDMVRGVPPKDFDVATSARPEDVQRAFRRVIPTGIQHGTVTVLSGGHPIEVTTFRTESEYLDGRRPSAVEFRSDVADDLSRRDFTINAMAYDPLADELVDPFGGQKDLEDRLIRCVGDPTARFSEDGLRPLRAIRFAAVLGFAIDPATEAAIPATLPVFRKVAVERVREELVKLLLSERPRLGLELLGRTGLLGGSLPEVAGLPPERFQRTLAVVEAAPPELEVRLAALLQELDDTPDAARRALERMKFPNKVVELTATLVRHRRVEPLFDASDAELRRFLSRLGPPLVRPLLALAEANGLAQAAPGPARALEERLERLLAQKPPLSARDLALDGRAIMGALGVGPSPAVGEASRFLLEQVLENPGLNSAAALTELLRDWAKAKGL